MASKRGDGTPVRGQDVPRDFWREIPCGHPSDPVAVLIGDCGGCMGVHAVCHCGWQLDRDHPQATTPPGAPGPVVPCAKCGCHVAVPSA